MILVTGATGFVGRHLCARLVRDGVRVRGLVRGGGAALPDGVEAAGAADLLDRPAVRDAMAGVDAVVHLAARVHVMRDRAEDPLAEFRRVNVEGTRVLLEEAVRAGVRKLVFASSVKAVGEGGDEALTEGTTPAPADPYGVSKLEAEALVRETAERNALHAPILRFPLVYGPGMKGNMLRLFGLVDRGVPLPFGSVRNRRSMLYVENAVEAVLAVLSAPEAGRELFLCSDGEDLSTPGLVRAVASALGRPARLLPVPPALFLAGGRVGDVVARVAPFPLTSAAVDRLLGSLYVDSSRLGRIAGFRPPVSVAEGLERTAAWYRRAAGGA